MIDAILTVVQGDCSALNPVGIIGRRLVSIFAGRHSSATPVRKGLLPNIDASRRLPGPDVLQPRARLEAWPPWARARVSFGNDGIIGRDAPEGPPS
jgi:hypothetical protein